MFSSLSILLSILSEQRRIQQYCLDNIRVYRYAVVPLFFFFILSDDCYSSPALSLKRVQYIYFSTYVQKTAFRCFYVLLTHVCGDRWNFNFSPTTVTRCPKCDKSYVLWSLQKQLYLLRFCFYDDSPHFQPSWIQIETHIIYVGSKGTYNNSYRFSFENWI